MFAQFLNAPSSINSTLLSTTVSNFLHPANAYAPISAQSRVKEVKLEQLLNA